MVGTYLAVLVRRNVRPLELGLTASGTTSRRLKHVLTIREIDVSYVVQFEKLAKFIRLSKVVVQDRV
jgi:hypothetical protein